MLPSRTYTVKALSAHPSRLIRCVMGREEAVVITLRGVPVVRLVPVSAKAEPPSIFDAWEAMHGVRVVRETAPLAFEPYAMRGGGSPASRLVLEDRW